MTKPSNNPMSAAQKNHEQLQKQRKDILERNPNEHGFNVDTEEIKEFKDISVFIDADPVNII
mgnify:CR=1 FL=1